MRRLLFLPRSWQSGFLILLTSSLLLTVGQVRGRQWQDEDSVIIEAATEDEKTPSNSIKGTARQKRQFGAGFPFGPNGFPQLPGFPGGFPGFPGGFPGGFPQLFPTIQPVQQTTNKPIVVQPGQTDSCLTRSGDPGYCATLRQCYPVVYSTVEGQDNNDGDEYLRNRGLAEILREKAGPCDTYTFYNIFMFRADAEARQRLICCPAPTKPPPQTIDNPNQTMRPPWAWSPPPTTSTTTTTERPKQSTYVPWTQWTQSTYVPWTQSTSAPWTQSTSAPWTQSTHVPWQHPTHPPLPTHPPDHTAATHPPFPQHPQQYPPTPKPPQYPQQHPTTQRPTQPPQQYPIIPQFPQQQPPPQHPINNPPPTNSPQVHPQPVGSSCGHTKVVGGVQAQKGEFPWLVALMNQQGHTSKQFCGGSLIDSQYILTAAHCVAHMTAFDVQKVRVQIGDYDIYSNSDGPVTIRSVSKLIRHRGFSHQTLHNDVALLKLDSPVQFGSNGNNNIQPVCLNDQGGYDSGSHKATVAGWGSVYENGPQPSIYRKVEMRVWTNQECAQKYGSYAPGGITSHMVCAGSGSADACRGDSGGPLAHNSGGRWTQIGIVSWGIGCGRYPGVYSRVDQFSPWITKNRNH